jgi:GNAT superfamily N-acetyltransferase
MPMLDLANGYYELPPGKLLNVVICLEMKSRPQDVGPGLPEGFELRRVGAGDLVTHRAIFRDVGADLMWFSRLIMADEKLKAILADPEVESFVAMQGATPIGILELNFREKHACELAFFGVSQKAIATGLGKALMNEALQRAWARPINRLWVHTCSHDHPRALGFYQKSGFKAYARMIEVHDDPRASGHLPKDAAPHVPMVDVS